MPPPSDPELLFLLPLVGRHHVGDWSAVERRLAATLESFRRQTSPRWRALVCSQDRPNLPDDSRIAFVPFREVVDGNDKWRKLAALCAALPAHMAEDGYAMPFDADDLLAPGAVADILTARAPGGALITRGYVYDAGTGGLALARPQSLLQPGQKAFWKLCGSCAAFRVRKATAEADATVLTAITGHEHRMFPHLAALRGAPLTPLRQPAALYIVNHGENFGVRRGRIAFKTRFVRRFPVRADARDAIVSAFDL